MAAGGTAAHKIHTMGRLIEIQYALALPARLILRVGDLLTFGASGGHVQFGTDVLEILGPFLPDVMGDNGKIWSPMESPDCSGARPSNASFTSKVIGRACTSRQFSLSCALVRRAIDLKKKGL